MRSKKLNSNVKIWLVFKLLKSISTGAEAGLKFCNASNMSDDLYNNFIQLKSCVAKNEPLAQCSIFVPPENIRKPLVF